MQDNAADKAARRHETFVQQQHDRQLNRSAIEANSAAAEMIAEKIASKIDEQNRIIFDVGARHGRTTFVAYLSLIIAAAAALGQLFGPAQDWSIWESIEAVWVSLKTAVGL